MKKILLLVVAGVLIVLFIVRPIYQGYMERAYCVEATSIIGAIIAAEEIEHGRTGQYFSADNLDSFRQKGVNAESEYYIFKVTTEGPNFRVLALTTPKHSKKFKFPTSGWIAYDSKSEQWSCDGRVVLRDFLPN